jgi:hypothetical protein
MANMKLIEAKTISSATTSISFTSIPQTYTDLKLLIASKSSEGSQSTNYWIQFNSDTGSNYTNKRIYSGTSSVGADTGNTNLNGISAGFIPGNVSSTTSTFSNCEIYIPNYRGSVVKTVSCDSSSEANTTSGVFLCLTSGLWNNTAAITSLTVVVTGSGVTQEIDSTFYLYGLESASISSYATGGAIYQDDTYFYHVFASSGVFTPTQSLSCDTLVIAGGGGGGRTGGGGGAGGLRGLTSQSMTAQAYTITIGAGGAGNNVDGQQAGDGTTSSIAGSGFSTINTTGGGGAASYGATTGRTGGSGGGGSAGVPNSTGGAGNAGSYSPVEGFAGGTGTTDSQRGGGGGGGGASEAGQSTTTGAVRIGGNGGNGSSAFSSWGVVTGTGENVSGTYWYAGGGGAASDTASLRGLGGNGGGGDAGTNNTNPSNAVPGMANTGGGGGANSGNYPAGANGGSGLVILRYAK